LWRDCQVWAKGWTTAVLLASLLLAGSLAAAQVKDDAPAQAPPGVAASSNEAVPAETADCTSMPAGKLKSECLRQHPYTGRMLLPDEKRSPDAPARGGAAPE
jgi:hypothetical protein